MDVRRTFEGEVSSVARSRRFVADVLADAGFDDDRVYLAQLVISELATNAVQHANTGFEVVVDIRDTVRLAVRDGSPVEPRPRTAATFDDGGRGLAILDRVCTRWGYEPDATGKWVWCELVLEGDPHASDRLGLENR